MSKSLDLTGNKYGMLTPLYRCENDKSKWVCRCDCGKIKSISLSNIRSGSSKSCGCKQGRSGASNSSYKHGGAHTKLHNVWKSMRQRCRNEKCTDYKWYGAKGIDVCQEWDNFSNFWEWSINNGYKDGLTIERTDSNRGYSPDNCRWITIEEQQRNKSNNHILEYKGKSFPMSVWSRKINMNYSTLRGKIRKGQTLYDILGE